MSSIDAAIDEIAVDMALFSDWEERYGYILELGRSLAPLSEAEHNEVTKVRGCASQVWLVSALENGRLRFRGDSDAHIVRGLIAILLKLFDNRTPDEILSIDPKAVFARLSLADALTPQRSNGVVAMLARIRADADAALHATA